MAPAAMDAVMQLAGVVLLLGPVAALSVVLLIAARRGRAAEPAETAPPGEA